MPIRNQILVIGLLLIVNCMAQDAFISSHESFSTTFNESGPLSQQYLVELNPQKFFNQWAALSTIFTSSNSDVLVELSFTAVYKENPTHVIQHLNKCTFKGNKIQWCKVGQRNPPINIHHHLIKLNLECLRGCQFTFIIGLAQTKWSISYPPRFLQGNSVQVSKEQLDTSKTEAFIRIGGWMLITLILILGAIKFAVKVADWVDERAEKAKQQKRKTKTKNE